MTAPLADYTDERFTDAERVALVRFEAAKEPEEIRVERVARALAEAQIAHAMYGGLTCACGVEVAAQPGWALRAEEHRLRSFAAAAIAAMEPPR